MVMTGITQDEFLALYIECGSQIADQFYPKNERAREGLEPSGRRGEYLRDLGVLASRLIDALTEFGVIIPERYLSTDEAARRLQIGASSVKKAVNSGQLTAKREGHAIRIPESSLLAYMESHGYNESGRKETSDVR